MNFYKQKREFLNFLFIVSLLDCVPFHDLNQHLLTIANNKSLFWICREKMALSLKCQLILGHLYTTLHTSETYTVGTLARNDIEFIELYSWHKINEISWAVWKRKSSCGELSATTKKSLKDDLSHFDFKSSSWKVNCLRNSVLKSPAELFTYVLDSILYFVCCCVNTCVSSKFTGNIFKSISFIEGRKRIKLAFSPHVVILRCT